MFVSVQKTAFSTLFFFFPVFLNNYLIVSWYYFQLSTIGFVKFFLFGPKINSDGISVNMCIFVILHFVIKKN